MQWTDEGIVLGTRRHGEANAILELMTRAHGRHLGLVYGGAGRRMRPVLQPGNRVTATWRARLDEHLGTYAVEGLELPAASFLRLSRRAVTWRSTQISALFHLQRLLENLCILWELWIIRQLQIPLNAHRLAF